LVEDNNPHGDRMVTGRELARCFEELKKSLGRSVIETIVYELEVMFGITLQSRSSNRLSEIDDALRKLLGDSAAELMMESIVKYLPKK
jgi:hypothetical protein